MKRYERTRALVEGDPALARAIVCEVERDGAQDAVAVLDEPREELVMVQARETAQGSLFFLGEALTTSCRVRVGDAWASRWDASLRAELARVEARDQREARRTAATKVDFSTMKVEA